MSGFNIAVIEAGTFLEIKQPLADKKVPGKLLKLLSLFKRIFYLVLLHHNRVYKQMEHWL